MKILIDSNVLISAALNADTTPFRTYIKATSFPHEAVICDYCVDEMKRVFNNKFPDKIALLYEFLSAALLSMELVSVPPHKHQLEEQIRDIRDRPILRAAIEAKVDILISGDKHFLQAGITTPAIMTPEEFLNEESALHS